VLAEADTAALSAHPPLPIVLANLTATTMLAPDPDPTVLADAAAAAFPTHVPSPIMHAHAAFSWWLRRRVGCGGYVVNMRRSAHSLMAGEAGAAAAALPGPKDPANRKPSTGAASAGCASGILLFLEKTARSRLTTAVVKRVPLEAQTNADVESHPQGCYRATLEPRHRAVQWSAALPLRRRGRQQKWTACRRS